MKWKTPTHRMNRVAGLGSLIALVAVATLVAAAQGDTDDILAQIRQEPIPAESAETSYGIPLSLMSLPQFVDWWTTLVPIVESDGRYVDALSALVAPCCDDNLAIKCCCENDEGQACNTIRSGKGLAAHLILDHDYGAEEIQASVLEWFRFARPDYYLAVELTNRGIDPQAHDLTVYGSCYRGLCNTPISQGGCGGMKQLIEPAIESTEARQGKLRSVLKRGAQRALRLRSCQGMP